jgi:hypothetical protein
MKLKLRQGREVNHILATQMKSIIFLQQFDQSIDQLTTQPATQSITRALAGREGRLASAAKHGS